MSKCIKIAGFDELYDYHIRKRCSEHDEIFFRARLRESQSRELEKLEKKMIKAYLVDENSDDGEERIEKNVFLGNVSRIGMKLKNSWYCDITAHSFSQLLDREPKRRIFQDQEKTLLEIIKAICKDYSGIVLKDQGADQISVPDPVVQYQETDWQFLVRITKKYGLDIAVDQDDATVNEGTLWVGKIDRKAKEISEDMLVEKMYSKEGITYKCISTDILEIGDRILFNNIEYGVIGCDFYLENNTLIRKYTFSSYTAREKRCPDLKGLMLKGKVTALEGEGTDKGQIQVKFDLEEGEAQKPVWIDWAVSFCDDNTGLYNMPSIGEKVLVHVLDDDGTELVAASGLRSSFVDTELKVTDKLFRVGNKQVLINDDRISVKNEHAAVLLENEKITIQTEKGSWVLDADGLSIDTNGKPVKIKSGEIKIEGDKMSVSCSSINLKGKVNVT